MIRPVLGLVALLAACGDDGGAGVVDADPTVDVAPDAPPREVVMETRALQPGEIVEGIMTSGPGDAARILLHGQFPNVSFNIHGHAGGGTQVVYEEFDKMDVDYLFKPTSQAKWYLLVRNDGQIAQEVEVKVEIYGEMMWEWE
ncbi:MAG: hypothetical protein AB7L94_39280 [Kofleriaceae bacterium]